MAANGHQNGQNGVHSFSGPPRYAPAMYAVPIEQPVVTLDASSAFQVGESYEIQSIFNFLKIKHFVVNQNFSSYELI